MRKTNKKQQQTKRGRKGKEKDRQNNVLSQTKRRRKGNEKDKQKTTTDKARTKG